ncbi:MAG: hypothetical protein JXJ04_17480 [Spirochaetales bacterium]|nr:hypothetical protein [Spirochaetales bacterium]
MAIVLFALIILFKRIFSEDDPTNKPAAAPRDSKKLILGYRLLQMVDHLKQHKSQLFSYLKLQGKPVNTGDLWGM